MNCPLQPSTLCLQNLQPSALSFQPSEPAAFKRAELQVQNEVPEIEKRANWIPTLAGPFFMAGRFYGPEASLIDGSYKIPECKRLP